MNNSTSTPKSTDTLKILVTKNQPGMTYWKEVFNSGKTDTAYVSMADDSVQISNLLPGQFDLFLFPLKVNNSWGNMMDSTQVVSKDTLTVPAGHFIDVYKIHSVFSNYTQAPDIDQDIWFKPGVGIIQLSSSQRNIFAQTWKLVSYQVK